VATKPAVEFQFTLKAIRDVWSDATLDQGHHTRLEPSLEDVPQQISAAAWHRWHSLLPLPR